MSEAAPAAVDRVLPPAVVTRIGNPVLTWLLSGPRRASAVGQNLLLLHLAGRRSGQVYLTPVAYHREPDGRLMVLTNSSWRVNLRGGPTPAQVTVLGRRIPLLGLLEEDPELAAQAYERRIEELGHESAGKRLGIRIDLDRAPTREELAAAARTHHLSVLHLELVGDSA